MPDLEDLFFDEGGTILLTAVTSPIVVADGSISGGLDNYTFDHDGDDDGFLPGSDVANSDGIADNDISDAAENGTENAYPGDIKDPASPSITAHPMTPDRNIVANDLVITEIMWALDNRLKGTDADTTQQWIEIYNTLNVPIPTTVRAGLKLVFSMGRPIASDADTKATLVDADAKPPVVDALGTTVLDRTSNVGSGGWGSLPPGQNGASIVANGDASDRIEFISMYRNRGKLGKNDGSNRGHWIASTNIYSAGYKGTPGDKERSGPKTFGTTSVARTPVIFNEIANLSAADNEWIELRNVSDAEANLKNWQISIVTDNKTDTEFFNFFNKDIKMAAGSVLLLVVSDPSGNEDHPLAAGFNIEVAADEQVDGVNADSARYLIMKKAEKDDNDVRGLKSAYADGEGLPNGGEFVLILRNGLDKEGKADKAIDIAGYHPNLGRDEVGIFTGLWPLINYTKPSAAGTLNKLEKDKVHRRQKADIDGTRTSDKKDNDDHGAFRDVGWTGIGYKRNADCRRCQRWNTGLR